MDKKVYNKYKKAGEIAASAINYGKKLIKPGKSFLEVADKVESKIQENGAGLSFPVNISVNEIAAHYTPVSNDKQVFKKGDVVKLDVGTHVDGFIADTAVAIELETNKYEKMIKASTEALDTAIKSIKPNIGLSELGKKIEDTIKSYGCQSIDNLTGHSLGKYQLHSGKSVPNVSSNFDKGKLEEGEAVAIEPFATNGDGHVISKGNSNIYRCKKSFKSRFIRNKKSKILFKRLKTNFKSLPFSERWTKKMFSNNTIVLRRLTSSGFLKHYPQLVEQNKGIVTQKEHTVIVTKDGCKITT